LLRSSSDEAKGLADKYRKRLYRLLDHHAEVLSAIQGGVRNYVGINQRLSKLGDDHSYALAIIREKDAQLEENKQFIERCLAEIKNKESLLMRGSDSTANQGNTNEIQHYSEKIENWMSQLNRMVDDYRNHIAQQELFIAECEQKIQAHESGLAGNQEYIAKCHARIAEQDAGIAENKGYIVACEERIRVQDEGLSLRDRDLADKTDQIISLEKQIVQFQDQLSGEHQKSLDSSEAYQQQQVVMRQLEQDILHLREENNSLSVRLSDADQSIKHKDESIFILRDEQALFRKNSEENREYIGKCHGRISEQDATLADQRVTISSLQERIHAAEERIRSQIEQMQQQDHQIHTVTSYRDELKKSMDDLQGRHDAIDLKSRDQLKSLTEKETVISDQKAIISSMEERIQGAEERMRSQIEQLQLQESAHKELRQQMSAQLALTDRIQGESQDWQERTRQTQAELDQVRQEVSRLEGLDRIHQQRLALQKQQLEKLRAHAAALESELVAIRSERVVLNAQLERYRSFRLVRTIDQIFPEKSS